MLEQTEKQNELSRLLLELDKAHRRLADREHEANAYRNAVEERERGKRLRLCIAVDHSRGAALRVS